MATHLVVDALGMPIDFEVTVGERDDNPPAPALIERVQPRELLADKRLGLLINFGARLVKDGITRVVNRLSEAA